VVADGVKTDAFFEIVKSQALGPGSAERHGAIDAMAGSIRCFQPSVILFRVRVSLRSSISRISGTKIGVMPMMHRASQCECWILQSMIRVAMFMKALVKAAPMTAMRYDPLVSMGRA